MDTLVIDILPKMLAFPFDESDLEAALGSDVSLEKLGVFFLYTSGIQVELYDPLTSTDTCYPVLALDDQMPALAATTRARLAETFKEVLKPDEPELTGAARADAQLAGTYHQRQGLSEATGKAPPELDLCDTACMVFAVKRRIRLRICDAISSKGARSIRNWFCMPEERRAKRPPLVLYYDEATDDISPRFCEKIEPGKPRYYR